MSVVTGKLLECDVLVAGGGPAGVPCAIAAARCGARVILVHDRPVLGGNASSEVRMHVVGADCSGHRGLELQTEAREGGIIEEIRLDLAVQNPQRSASMLDLVLYDKCRAEPDLTLLLNTAVTRATCDGRNIQHVTAERTSTEERFQIRAGVFVDCTGDGRLGAEAGAKFRHGRESKAEFGESLAQDQGDDHTLGSTLLFQARKHDRPMPFIPPAWIRKVTEDDLKLRPHALPGIDQGLEYGYWWLEWGGTLDTIKDNEIIRDELLKILLGVWDHVKNGGDHGADNWALDWFGFLPGKRESRRFIGQHTLTQHDVMNSTPFDDAIAYGGWPIDTHPPKGVDAKDEAPCTQHHVPHLYDIPLRACVSRDIDNLLFAGRNISATHLAFASTRVMATCAVVGQGVGTAAAYAARFGKSAGSLASNPAAIHAIQQRLLRDDAFLIGKKNDDLLDLARRAKISASSEQSTGPAINVVSGQTRAVHGEKGAVQERVLHGTNRWMSDPSAGTPSWIQLDWDKPIVASSIQLIFDSGQHRVLTLSHSDAYVAKMLWGQPQLEMARDYTLEFRLRGEQHSVIRIRDNHQRRRVHPIDEPRQIDSLRIVVEKTHGLDHARICEVRVYRDPPRF